MTMGRTLKKPSQASGLLEALSSRDHKRVSSFVEHTAGIQLPASKRSLIEGRLRKRQRTLGISSLHDYVDYVFDTVEGEKEKVHLLDALTTNKTDFYRESDHFAFLREYICKQVVPKKQQGWRRPFRIWSAGCSSGEEPYTLAIEMMELQRRLPGFRFQIDATDISLTCLQKAGRAIYDHDRIEPMDMDLRKRYLLRNRDKLKEKVMIAPKVTKHVRFKSFNLLTDEYRFESLYDIIFCRNVMIYFNNEDRMEIAARFAHSLVDDGLLFIGHSETLTNSNIGLEQVKPTIYAHTGRGLKQ